MLTRRVGRGKKELQAEEFNLMAEDFGHSENFSVKLLWAKGDDVLFQ